MAGGIGAERLASQAALEGDQLIDDRTATAGAWGDLGADDMAANDDAARTGDGRLTTVLFPDDD